MWLVYAVFNDGAQMTKITDILADSIDSLLSEQVHRIELYHGTSLKNAKKIMKEGLKPAGGDGWGGAGVKKFKKLGDLYFTGSKGTAVRYAQRFDVPVVLKVAITKPERVANIDVDPLDDPFSGEYGMERHFDESPVFDLANDLNRFAKKRGWGRTVFAGRFGIDNPILPNFEYIRDHERALKHFNLYKSTKEWLQDNFRKDKADNEYRHFLRNFRPGDYGYVTLRNNGQLRINADYLKDQHQLKYPDALPPAAIKEVWVEVNTLEQSGIRYSETVSVDSKRLASEIRMTTEWMSDVFKDVDRKLMRSSYISDIRDIREYLEEEIQSSEDKAIEDEFRDFAEPVIDALEDMIDNRSFSYDRAQEIAMTAREASGWALDAGETTSATGEFASTKLRLGNIKPEQLNRVKGQ